MTITEQAFAGETITGQLVELSWKDAWLHEPRGPHGEWIRTGVADLVVHRDGTVTSKKTKAEFGGLTHEDGKWVAAHGDGTVSAHASRGAALKAMVSRHGKAGKATAPAQAPGPSTPAGTEPAGILSGAHPADRVTVASDPSATAKAMSDADLKSADQELSRRAAVLGKLGQKSRAHEAVTAERQRRKGTAASARQAGKPPAPASSASGTGPAGNDAKALAAAVKSGVASRKAPGSADVEGSQGAQGGVEVVTFGNGAQYIHKDFKNTMVMYPASMGGDRLMPREEMRLQVARESLAAKVSDAIGAGAPAVIRDPHSATGFYEPKVAGVSAMEHFKGGRGSKAAVRMYNSPEGMKIGLMDMLTGAGDRHLGNVMVTPDGKPVPIDHNDTWGSLRAYSPFTDALNARVKAGKSPFTTADLDQVKGKIQALKPEFEAMPGGEGARYYQMTMGKLAQVRGQVAGQ